MALTTWHNMALIEDAERSGSHCRYPSMIRSTAKRPSLGNVTGSKLFFRLVEQALATAPEPYRFIAQRTKTSQAATHSVWVG